MNQVRVLDSYALLAYLNQEEGFEKVRALLAAAQKKGDISTSGKQPDASLLMNEINVGETYYILYRKRGPEKAKYFLETVLPGLPIVLVPNNFEYVIDASRIKAQYPLSFPDCFLAITAQHTNGVIVTGDPEFKKIAHLVQVEWLR